MIFFGKQVSETGCEMVIKVGSRWADPENDGHLISWRDGQIIDVMPLGFHTGTQVGYCCALLKFPNIDYTALGGRWEDAWKKMPAEATLWDKINHTVDKDGKYAWDLLYDKEHLAIRKNRDYFIDFKALESVEGLITLGEKESVYDFDQKTILTLAPVFSPDNILKHEEVDTRLDIDKLFTHASITEGVHSIGAAAGLDYDTVTLFEAAIGATLSGALTGEHNAEETAVASAISFDTVTNTHLLKLTAQSGDEHTGGAYGNGARIIYGTYDNITFNSANIADMEVSNLALNVAGEGNTAINCVASGAGEWLVNRVLIKGDGSASTGIRVVTPAPADLTIANSIIYDFTATDAEGILHQTAWAAKNIRFLNNTIINCFDGINIDQPSTGTWEIKNNLVQASNASGDDYQITGTWDHAKNISEDTTSPDTSYRSKDLHTNSVFKNYASDDYRLDSGGNATNLAIVDDGEDLSGTFTDDIEGQTRDTWYIGASEIVVSLALEQEGFRWRDDDDSEAAATGLALQDIDITRAKETNTRLRILLNATGDQAAKQFKLQYKKTSDATWRDMPES